MRVTDAGARPVPGTVNPSPLAVSRTALPWRPVTLVGEPTMVPSRAFPEESATVDPDVSLASHSPRREIGRVGVGIVVVPVTTAG
jgi:hypothetical protein